MHPFDIESVARRRVTGRPGGPRASVGLDPLDRRPRGARTTRRTTLAQALRKVADRIDG